MQNCYHQKRCFKLKMHHKPFGGRALLGPAGKAHSVPTETSIGLRMRGARERKEDGTQRGEGGKGREGKDSVEKRRWM